jgi:pyroglutamyl-peptidase
MRILITAFGPFGGRSRNASSLALAGLKRRLPRINSRVFPVDAVVAPRRMDQALRQTKPDVLIMLGEAGGSTSVRLESTAWNELDFRIPDNAGRQPLKSIIDPESPASLPATLPLEMIRQQLTAAGHPVEISSDPGRFLCNQMLFHALRSIARQTIPTIAGFIHLPLESDYPTIHAVNALATAVATIAQSSTVVSNVPSRNT